MVWPWRRSGGRGDPALGRVRHRRPGPTVPVPDQDPDQGLGRSAPAPVGSSGTSPQVPIAASRSAGGIVGSGLRPIPTGESLVERPAFDLVGVDTSGNPVEVSVLGHAGRTLLAFLAVDCFGCEEFWRGIGDAAILPGTSNMARIVVAKERERIPPAKSALLAGVPLVVSDAAWSDYRVLGYPSFLVVDGSSGMVVGETTAFGWDDVQSMIRSIAP